VDVVDVDLVIFHYHLQPGGVTSVIRTGVQSLGSRSRIRLVAGRVPERDRAFPGAEVVHCPEIDYAPAQPVGGALWRERAKRLADSLAERFGGGGQVWWIHNYHLGKNPLFTEAILRLAASQGGPRMILQPHDFPEAGRFRNLSALNRLVTLPLYPLGPRVRYALINRRDLHLLRDAGIPESRLFLLENPVGPPVGEAAWVESKRGLRSLVFPGADARHPTLLYPVRSIRRKNVLEAGMLLRLVDTPLRLVVTLPGVSKSEKEYSGLVEDAFRSGLIPGEFGTGVRRADLRPESLAAACDAMVSSSVQEGFGYLFVQALQWGLPLLARSLETIRGFDGLYEDFPAFFYEGLSCPLEPSERAGLLRRYRGKLRRIRKLLPAGAVERLDGELARVFEREEVDFSFLDPPLQVRLLASTAEPSALRSAIRKLNHTLARSLDALLADRPPARVQSVEQRFGLSAYASHVSRLLESFDQPAMVESQGDPAEVQERVRAFFARMEHMRLLYD
jgi:hypothetical protein